MIAAALVFTHPQWRICYDAPPLAPTDSHYNVDDFVTVCYGGCEYGGNIVGVTDDGDVIVKYTDYRYHADGCALEITRTFRRRWLMAGNDE